MIGIDSNTWLVYEGTSKYGHGVWPTPFISRATLLKSDEDFLSIRSYSPADHAKCMFREESFDPVTRIRRGRLYVWGDGIFQPDEWYVQRHPAIFEEVGERDFQDRYLKRLLTYRPLQGLEIADLRLPRLAVGLGTLDALTLWSVVATEMIASGECMVTLKARSNLGALPELLLNEIPTDRRTQVAAAVERVVDGAYRSSGVVLVDLCRDATQVIISTWLASQASDKKFHEKDLGALVKAIPLERRIILNAVDLIRVLHPRGKSNEQEKLGLRPIDESDGQFALSALTLILRELGWAR